MSVDEEIEKIESIIADIESAISEAKDCEYFEYKVSGWEEDLSDLNERLQELEQQQSSVWQREIAHQNYEYERSVL